MSPILSELAVNHRSDCPDAFTVNHRSDCPDAFTADNGFANPEAYMVDNGFANPEAVDGLLSVKWLPGTNILRCTFAAAAGLRPVFGKA